MGHEARRSIPVAAVFAAGSFCGGASAQDFPIRPIKIIVPFAAGTGVDIATRQVAARLGPAIGQPAVVENRPGASGIIGTEAAAKSAPDGDTLYCGPITTVAMVPFLYSKLPFDMTRDFAAITQISLSHTGIMVHPDIPVKNLQESIAWPRPQPRQYAHRIWWSSSGPRAPKRLAIRRRNSPPS